MEDAQPLVQAEEGTPFPTCEVPDWMKESDGRLKQFMELPIDRPLQILTVPGIGDFSWVWAKLWCLENVTGIKPLFIFPDDGTRRVAQYADILGIDYDFRTFDIREVLRYDGEFSAEEYKAGGAFYVQANRHLERGKRIEQWHQDLPLRNPITPYLDRWQDTTEQNYVTLHMCMASYVEGNYLPRRWARMIEHIERNFAPVKIVGALWDTAFAKRVTDFYTPHLEPCLDRPLAESLRTIAAGRAHIGLDSGLTILSKYLGTPALQAFPRWLCDPKPTAYHPGGTHMPGTYDFGFHAKSRWCYVDELMDEYEDFLEGIL